VYIGNVSSHQFIDTYCARRDEKIIDRREYIIVENNFEEWKCQFCGYEIQDAEV